MSERQRSFLLASLGGIAGTTFDVAALAALAERGTPIAIAAFVGAMAGAGVCFVVNKYVAFRDRRPLALRQVSAFTMVALATALMMAGAMYVACDLGHLPYLLGKLVCAALVFGLWSYPAQRRLVFVPS